jgi:hypothetical protein
MPPIWGHRNQEAAPTRREKRQQKSGSKLVGSERDCAFPFRDCQSVFSCRKGHVRASDLHPITPSEYRPETPNHVNEDTETGECGIYQSEMALFNECLQSCAHIVLDSADIVRDGDLTPTMR